MLTLPAFVESRDAALEEPWIVIEDEVDQIDEGEDHRGAGDGAQARAPAGGGDRPMFDFDTEAPSGGTDRWVAERQVKGLRPANEVRQPPPQERGGDTTSPLPSVGSTDWADTFGMAMATAQDVPQMPLLSPYVRRPQAIDVSGIGIGTGGNQSICGLMAIQSGRNEQRRQAMVTSGIDVGIQSRRAVQRRHPGIVPGANVRAGRNQGVYNARRVPIRRNVQRRLAEFASGIHIGAGDQQHLDGTGLVPVRCSVQRCTVGAVASVDVGAGGNQLFDRLPMSTVRSVMQVGPALRIHGGYVERAVKVVMRTSRRREQQSGQRQQEGYPQDEGPDYSRHRTQVPPTSPAGFDTVQTAQSAG